MNDQYEGDDVTTVTLKFRGVEDVDRLRADIDMLLESLGEDGVLSDVWDERQ